MLCYIDTTVTQFCDVDYIFIIFICFIVFLFISLLWTVCHNVSFVAIFAKSCNAVDIQFRQEADMVAFHFSAVLKTTVIFALLHYLQL